MKKFLTVLAIALIAMTAVFATKYNGDNLTLKLNIAADTTVGFTTEKITDASIALSSKAFSNNELNVASSQTVAASCITRSASKVTIDVTVSDLTGPNNSTIGANFANNLKTISYTEQNTSTAKRAISVDASLTIADYSNSLAGEYTGTMTLTVTAD